MSVTTPRVVRRSIAAVTLSFAALSLPAAAQDNSAFATGAFTTPVTATTFAAEVFTVSKPVALTRTAPKTVGEHAAELPVPAPRGFASSGLAQFMSSPAGRATRVIAGLAMIGGGIAMDSNGGTVLSIAGAIPLSAGAFDLCYLSPIFGGPIKGTDIRAAKR